ncbi:MAG: hypothetical protein ACI8T1_002520 [Verrucomicrobiales bacterium]
MGEESALEDPLSRKRRGSRHPKAVATVARQDGRLNVAQVVRVRMRYFTDSVVLGSQAWVEEVFERNREQLRVKREGGARELKAPGLDAWRGLVDLRGGVE